MPIYEFLCKKCENKFSVMTSISKKDEVKCPRCNSSDLQQMFGNVFSFSRGSSSCRPPVRGGFS
ncbi:MAG TPA: zinc ribbon domain-containing protein [Firmicutes bacterium]|nr:zinc ribbon domain-containing protein [Bacillota bacterium]